MFRLNKTHTTKTKGRYRTHIGKTDTNAQTHYPGVSPFASYQYHKKRLIVVSDFTTLPDLAGNEAADEGGNVR